MTLQQALQRLYNSIFKENLYVCLNIVIEIFIKIIPANHFSDYLVTEPLLFFNISSWHLNLVIKYDIEAD